MLPQTNNQAGEPTAAELRVVSRILQLLNAAPHINAVFPQIFTNLQAIIGCTVASLAMLGDDQCVTFITHNREHGQTLGRRILVQDSAAGSDILNGKLHLTPDLAVETGYVVEKNLYAAGIRSRINLPLTVEHQVMGSLNLGWNVLQGPQEQHLPLLRQVAEAMALALSKTRLYEAVMRRADELAALETFSRALRVTVSLAETRRIVIAEATTFFQALDAAIVYPHESGETMGIVAAQGLFQSVMDQVVNLEHSISGTVFRTGQPYRTRNLLQDELAQTNIIAKLGNYDRAAIIVPLRIEQNVVGVFLMTRDSMDAFSAEDERLLTAMAEVAGSALHRAAIMETLEERVKLRTKELAQANERLQELDRLKGKFIHDISHELRTPISNLGLYLHLLAEGAPEKRSHYVTVLRKQVRRLSQLVEDVLQISRLQRDEPVAFEWVDLPALLKQVADQLGYLQTNHTRLCIFSSDELRTVWGNANLLAQMIGHLLNNAIIYTLEGEVNIRTGLDAGKEYAFIRITDTGIGIPPEELPHLFQRFYRGERASQSRLRGSGLGLSIVKEIVDLHQGKIEVDSHVNEGSTFTIWLPTCGSEGVTG